MHETETLCEREPECFTAGDTVRWRRRFLQHPPSDGWALHYYFRGPDAFDFVAQVEGDEFIATIAATTSETLAAGTYGWVARVEKAGEVYTEASGATVVFADPASADPTRNEEILAAIDAVLENRITNDIYQVSINGRAITRMRPEELMAARSRYAYLVEIERRRGRLPPLVRPL